jgi:acyl-CoA thioesterase FadM
MEQILVCGESDVVHSTCKTVLVAIDHQSGDSIPVSNELREKIGSFETF